MVVTAGKLSGRVHPRIKACPIARLVSKAHAVTEIAERCAPAVEIEKELSPPVEKICVRVDLRAPREPNRAALRRRRAGERFLPLHVVKGLRQILRQVTSEL